MKGSDPVGQFYIKIRILNRQCLLGDSAPEESEPEIFQYPDLEILAVPLKKRSRVNTYLHAMNSVKLPKNCGINWLNNLHQIQDHLLAQCTIDGFLTS